jgi:Flp pilus assembly protein CpaB
LPAWRCGRSGGTRTRCGIVVETGEAREVQHFALLTGYGAGAVNPYLAFATIDQMQAERIIAGEYIRTERLAAKDAGVGLNAIIPKGLRAVSINVTDSSAVSGFLNPGNYVDIITSLVAEEKSIDMTITMLQARKVLAVNNRVGSDAGFDYKTDRNYMPSVTLAVTPAEAEKLAHASAQSQLTLTLRNDIDVEPVKNEPIDSSKLIGQIDKPAAPIAPVKVRRPISELPKPKEEGTLTIIRAGQQTIEKVRSDGSTYLR